MFSSSCDLCQHYTDNNIPKLWKVWSAKFRRNITQNVKLQGCASNADIYPTHLQNNLALFRFSRVYRSLFLAARNEVSQRQ